MNYSIIKNISCFFCWIALLLFLAGTGCVSIKPSSVKLSQEVGNRLTEMQGLHQLAIQRYFDMEKQKVDDFLTKKWEPLFLKNFLGTSNVLNMLQNVAKINDDGRSHIEEVLKLCMTDPSKANRASDEIVSKLTESRRAEDNVVRAILTPYVGKDKLEAAVIRISALLGTDEPARIIFEFAEAAHLEMNNRRKSLMDPIDQASQETMAALSAAYGQLIAGQNAVTARLEAAAKMSKQQDELLGKLGMDNLNNTVLTKLADMSSKVNKGLAIAEKKLDDSKDKNTPGSLNDIFEEFKTELLKKN